MKWLKTRTRYLNEAKIRDYILPRQQKELVSRWGEKFLDYEEVDPTDKIKQGKWKLSDEDKFLVLNAFFGCDINRILKKIDSLSDKFTHILEQSLDKSIISNASLKEKVSIIFDTFNAKRPSVDQMSMLYEPIFKSLSVGETKSDSVIQRDETGKPLKDENSKIIKVAKEAGAPIFSKNLVNIKGVIDDYNKCYVDDKIDFQGIFNNSDITRLVSMSKENHNSQFKFDFKIFDRDLYLSINHNPRDILNMSISKFFASCMHLYTGGYRDQLLANVFDPNSIPAFLTFDTEIYWQKEKISDFLPLTRMMLRNIESFNSDENVKVYFDRAYPDRMKKVFDLMVIKYSENKQTATDRDTYIYTPDIDPGDNLSSPYMDRMRIKKHGYIGKNTKSLYLNRSYDWSQIKISPSANIKEIVVETDVLPENMANTKLKPEWIKFKLMKISNLDPFKEITTEMIAFDKCRLNLSVLDSMSDKIKNLQLISSEIVGDLDLSKFENLEELELVYTLDTLDQLKAIVSNLELKKLSVSGDLFSTPEGKTYLKSLRKGKMEIKIIGPVV